MTTTRKLLIANPTYTPGSVSRMAAIYAYQTPDLTIYDWEQTASLVTWSFNQAWATALNLREEVGLTHFLLLHSDIRPVGTHWLPQLFDLLTTNNADLVSVISPIKDERGLSSTAIDTDPWRPLRLTMHQIHTQLPETWYADEALFNTGLMLVDMSGSWVEKICFTMQDRIIRGDDGKWIAMVEPEDWNFSRQCRRLGVRALITRKIAVEHFGWGCWRSDRVWGLETDPNNSSIVAAKLAQGLTSRELLDLSIPSEPLEVASHA